MNPKLMDEVITQLEQDKPITLKQGCSMLGITYNTTRLRKLITEHKQSIITNKAIRAKMLRTPVTNADRKAVVESYITGESITAISMALYRSIAVVKRILSEYNIPLTHNALLEKVTEGYNKDDLVYSVKYNCPALVMFRKESKTHGACYNLYLLGGEEQRAYQPYYELADLTRCQKELGITVRAADGIRANGIIWSKT